MRSSLPIILAAQQVCTAASAAYIPLDDTKHLSANDPVIGLDFQLDAVRSAISYPNGSVVEGASVETDVNYRSAFRRLRSLAYNVHLGRHLGVEHAVSFYETSIGVIPTSGDQEDVPYLEDIQYLEQWSTPAAEKQTNPCDTGLVDRPFAWLNEKVLGKEPSPCFFDQYAHDPDVLALTALAERVLLASKPKLDTVGASMPLYCEVAMPTWLYTAWDPDKDRSGNDSPAIDAPPNSQKDNAPRWSWQNPTREMRWFEPFARKFSAAAIRAGCRGPLDFPDRKTTKISGVQSLPAGYLAIKSANVTGCEAPTAGLDTGKARCTCSGKGPSPPTKALLYDFWQTHLQIFAARFGGDETLPYIPWSSYNELGGESLETSPSTLTELWEMAWKKTNDVIKAVETEANKNDDWTIVLGGDALKLEGARAEIRNILGDLLEGKNFKFVDAGLEDGDPAFGAAVGATREARQFVDPNAGCDFDGMKGPAAKSEL